MAYNSFIIKIFVYWHTYIIIKVDMSNVVGIIKVKSYLSVFF